MSDSKSRVLYRRGDGGIGVKPEFIDRIIVKTLDCVIRDRYENEPVEGRFHSIAERSLFAAIGIERWIREMESTGDIEEIVGVIEETLEEVKDED